MNNPIKMQLIELNIIAYLIRDIKIYNRLDKMEFEVDFGLITIFLKERCFMDLLQVQLWDFL